MYMLIMTLTLEFAISWVVCVLTFIPWLVFFQLMRLILGIVYGFTLKRHLPSLIVVTSGWSLRLNFLRIVFSLIGCRTLEFSVPWDIFMIAILDGFPWNFFVLVARVVLGFTIKIA